MYGLNPSIIEKDNPNSPYFESHCDFCKLNSCEGCIYNPDADDDKVAEDYEFNPEILADMYQYNL